MVGSIPADRSFNRRSAWLLIFLASMVLAGAVSLLAVAQFLVPSLPFDRVGNMAVFQPSSSPYWVYTVGNRPVWVVNTGAELILLDPRTTHDKTRWPVKWVPSTNRFEDPVTGSKFTLTGEWIEGPATRDLDRYAFRVLPDGTLQLDPWQITLGEDHP
jgi:hypothetical protein